MLNVSLLIRLHGLKFIIDTVVNTYTKKNKDYVEMFCENNLGSVFSSTLTDLMFAL